MKWHKLGQVFVPDGSLWWARKRAYLPTPEVLPDAIRVYFASYDEDDIGRIGFVDLHKSDPTKILAVSQEPVFGPGPLGSFDGHGVSPSCIVHYGKLKWLYYFGWQRVEDCHPLLFTGMAYERDGGFSRWANIPVLDRTRDEPFGKAGAFVMRYGDEYRAWYASFIDWIDIGENELYRRRIYPRYNLRQTSSSTPLEWLGKSSLAIDFRGDDEFGLGRPWVVKDDGLWRIWYSIRSQLRPYSLGYAESKDGMNWTRKDHEVGLIASESGWDSEMICFPAVFDIGNQRYVAYNGNNHGETGFGLAILERD